MDDLEKLVGILQRLKKSGNLSTEEVEEVDEAIELVKTKKKKDLAKGLAMAAKYLYDWLKDLGA